MLDYTHYIQITLSS